MMGRTVPQHMQNVNEMQVACMQQAASPVQQDGGHLSCLLRKSVNVEMVSPTALATSGSSNLPRAPQ